jgi:dihydrolipoamide dehydrogenase
MQVKHYDTIVIGSGGGTKLVRPVADLGKKVALAEMESPGGTCLNRGCIPSKMLIYPAHIVQTSLDTKKLNLNLKGNLEVNFSELVERISETVDSESDSIPPIYNSHANIDYYPSLAKFVGEKEIEVQNVRITGDKIFLAVGCRPFIPRIPGLSESPYWTSREALRNKVLPKKLIVYGGGYIALELGMAYSAFGTEVTFIVRSRLLRNEDHEIREAYCDSISDKVKIHENTSIQNVNYSKETFAIQTDNPSLGVLESDALLIATGIQPNSDLLNLQNTKIKTDRDGYIQTNGFLETTAHGIYALGDVTGRYFFRHSVNFEGEYLFENLYKKSQSGPIHYPPIPHAVFTHPEVASVGLTEESCRLAGFDYIKATHPYKSSAAGMARLPKYGLVKIILDKKSRTVLGAHILGDEASNMIHMIILGMTLGAKLEDYLNMVYIHPALPEIVRNAFRRLRDTLS